MWSFTCRPPSSASANWMWKRTQVWLNDGKRSSSGLQWHLAKTQNCGAFDGVFTAEAYKMGRLVETNQMISPLLTVLPWRKGSVFGTTPVALTTKSQPKVFPLVSWTRSGHESPVGRQKRLRIRQITDTVYRIQNASQHSHHSLAEPVPQGWWFFPLHTHIPAKLCGGPDHMPAERLDQITCRHGLILLYLFQKKKPKDSGL